MSDLINAVKDKDIKKVEELLIKKVSLTERDDTNWGTALHWAVYNNCKEIVILLLKHDADYSDKTAQTGLITTTPQKDSIELAEANQKAFFSNNTIAQQILLILQKKKAVDKAANNAVNLADSNLAIRELTKLLESKVEYPSVEDINHKIYEIYCKMASTHLELGETSKNFILALNCFDKALEIKKDDLIISVELKSKIENTKRTITQYKDFEDAIQILDRKQSIIALENILRSSTNNHLKQKIHIAIAKKFYELKDYCNAVDQLQEAFTINKNNVFLFNAPSNIFYEGLWNDLLSNALKHADLSIEEPNENRKKELRSIAIKHYEKILQLYTILIALKKMNIIKNDCRGFVYFKLGILFEHDGNLELAVNNYQEALNYPENKIAAESRLEYIIARAQIEHAIVYDDYLSQEFSEKISTSLSRFKSALDNSRSDEKLLMAIIKTYNYLCKKLFEEAKKYADDSRKKIVLVEREKDRERAIKIYMIILDINSNTKKHILEKGIINEDIIGYCHTNLGRLMEEKGEILRAKQNYNEALKYSASKVKAESNLEYLDAKQEAKSPVNELDSQCAILSHHVYNAKCDLILISMVPSHQEFGSLPGKSFYKYAIHVKTLEVYYIEIENSKSTLILKLDQNKVAKLQTDLMIKFSNLIDGNKSECLITELTSSALNTITLMTGHTHYRTKSSKELKRLLSLSDSLLDNYELICTTDTINYETNQLIDDTNKVGKNLSVAGYFAAVYLNVKKNKVIIANRGSDFTENGNLAADMLLIGNRIHPIWALADKLTLLIINKYPGYEFIHTGHSLGAVVAEVTAWLHGHKAITFESPGSMVLIKRLNKNRLNKVNNKKLKVDLKKSHVCYFTSPNLVNTLHEHVGRQYRLYLSVDFNFKDQPKINPFEFIDSLVSFIESWANGWAGLAIKKFKDPTEFINKLKMFRDALKKRFSPLLKIITRDFDQHYMGRIAEELKKKDIKRGIISEWPRGPGQYAELAMLMIESGIPDAYKLSSPDSPWQYFFKNKIIHYNVSSASDEDNLTINPASKLPTHPTQHLSINTTCGQSAEQRLSIYMRHLCPDIYQSHLQMHRPDNDINNNRDIKLNPKL